MGGNGSYASGVTNTEAGRHYITIATIGDIQILEKKNRNDSCGLPEESHTPNRIYAEFRDDGSDVGKIAVYGQDCKKLYEIHTTDHKNLHEHYHKWSNGGPIGTPKPLTSEMLELLQKVREFNQ